MTVPCSPPVPSWSLYLLGGFQLLGMINRGCPEHPWGCTHLCTHRRIGVSDPAEWIPPGEIAGLRDRRSVNLDGAHCQVADSVRSHWWAHQRLWSLCRVPATWEPWASWAWTRLYWLPSVMKGFCPVEFNLMFWEFSPESAWFYDKFKKIYLNFTPHWLLCCLESTFTSKVKHVKV